MQGIRNIYSLHPVCGAHHIKTYFCTVRRDYLPIAHPFANRSNAFYFECAHLMPFDACLDT